MFVVALGCGGAAPDRTPPVLQGSGRLAAGTAHVCRLGTDGAIRCWGDNTRGQLGRATGGTPVDARVDLGRGRRATGVFAGQQHTCAVLQGNDEDGAVKCWGANTFGQLGLEDTADRGDGTTPLGDDLPVVQLGAGRRAISLAAGATATCALLDDGSVKCWGDGYQGALGTGDTDTRGAWPGTMGDQLPAVDLGTRDGVPLRARQVVAVDYHSFCAVIADPAARASGSNDSGLKCWGSNDYCELGLGTRQGGLANEPATTGDGLPFVDLGRTATGEARRAVAAAAGFQFVCVVGHDGAVLCWGDNSAAQLGHGPVGRTVSCAPNETGDANRVPLPARAVAIGARGLASGGGAHACALLDSGQVMCWGENGAGQLGTGDTLARMAPAAPFDLTATTDELVLGNDFSCAVSAAGAVSCWGSNRAGQLGPSVPTELVLTPVALPEPGLIP